MKIFPEELAFDIDGVMADTFRVFVERARNEFGYDFTYDDITEYDFLSVLDMDREISERIIQDLIEDPVASGIRPIRGAVEVLTRLSSRVPLFFVTARPEVEAIGRWVHRQLTEVAGERIRIEATYAGMRKPEVLFENGVKYFVEDRLETCFLLQGTSVTPIVFDQPWNRKPHPFSTVKSWKDLSALIVWE